MKNVPEHILNEFIQACHKIAGHGLVRCSSGNLSIRIDEERFLVTSSRSWMENISSDTISVCRISDGQRLEGGKPSAEVGFHSAILGARTEINVVLHFQTPCATALSCCKQEPPSYFVIPEIPFYIGHVIQISYLQPGSRELADAVTEAMLHHNMVNLKNHGQVTAAEDIDHAIQNALFFELACEIIIRGCDKVQPISEKDAAVLIDKRLRTEISV